MEAEPPGGTKRGRAKRRFLDVVREDMELDGVREEDTEALLGLK